MKTGVGDGFIRRWREGGERSGWNQMRRIPKAKVRVWRERAPARKGPAGAPAESRDNFPLLSLGAPSLLICVHLSGPRAKTQSEPEFLDRPLLLASGLAYRGQLGLLQSGLRKARQKIREKG